MTAQFTPTRKHEITGAKAQIEAQLRAGRHVRCPSCLNWFDRRKLGAVAVFIPHNGGDCIGYAICKRCEPHIKDEGMTDRIESYLTGGAA